MAQTIHGSVARRPAVLVASGPVVCVGLTPVEIKEIVYQAVPYVGMAKVFDFIHATNEVLTERGVDLPLPGHSTTTPENRAGKGVAIEKQIVGCDVVENLYASAPDDQLHIQHYLSANLGTSSTPRGGSVLPATVVAGHPRRTVRQPYRGRDCRWKRSSV
jgi:4-carboxymuconolactone decarboxylase